MVWFTIFYLQTICTDFCQIVGTKQSVATKTSTTFFPKSSPSKTEYHLATKKTSSNPVACCHFVKESHGFSPWHLFHWAAISKLFVHHHRGEVLSPWDFHHPIWGTTWPWRSDPHFFRKSNMSKWEKFTGKIRIWVSTPLKKCEKPKVPGPCISVVFCPKKMVGSNRVLLKPEKGISHRNLRYVPRLSEETTLPFPNHPKNYIKAPNHTTSTTHSLKIWWKSGCYMCICVHLCLNPNFFVGRTSPRAFGWFLALGLIHRT